MHHRNDAGSTGYLTGNVHSCLLAEGEFIQRLEYSNHLFAGIVPVVGCITLTTTDKTCGPHGNVCSPTVGVLEGYHVLYMSGRKGQAIDSIDLTYEDC